MAASRADLSILLRLIDEMTPELDKATRGVQKHLDSVARDATRAGGLLTAAITAPVIGAGLAAVKMAQDFDKSMTKIVALVGVNREQVGLWREDIKSISKETDRSTTELAEALFFITSAGLRGSEAIDALRASAQAADTGLGETKVIADAVTSAMNAYGSANLSAAQATAILVAGVREGKTEAEALAPAIGRVIPVAAELGIGFDQVTAAIATMTRLGLDASEATTALRGIMVTLVNPTAEAERQLRAVGLSAADLRSQVREQGLLAVLHNLRESFAGNEEAMSNVFGNVRALTGVLNLVGQNAEAAEAVFASLAQTTEKDLAVAFEEANKRAGEASETLQTQLNLALLELGEVVLPVVIPVIIALTGALVTVTEWFGNLAPEVQTGIVVIAGLAAVVGPIILTLGLLAGSISALLPVIGLVVVILAGPVGWIALLVAVGAALVVLYQTNQTFRDIVLGVWNFLGKEITRIIDLWMGRVNTLKSVITGAWEKLQGLAGAVGATASAAGTLASNIPIPGAQTLPGQFRLIPGATSQPRIIMAHGGEVIGRPGAGGVTLNINVAEMVIREEADIQRIARALAEQLQAALGLGTRIPFGVMGRV
jgi:TP901 family phage tail tape measure protein